MSDVSVRAIAGDAPAIENSISHIGYRAYIDGLRAVAVIPVVLCHAGFTVVGGGFVGVDVFFVISGFLITSLIMSDLDAGKFSLLDFYERRIRRIFPALFAVVAACSIAAWLVFMPVEFTYFARSAIATALFGSNILFWDESGYFDAAAQLKPLLHTWSLAVEEQFYIFFPLLLMLLHRIQRLPLLAVLAAFAIVSFVLNLWATYHEPEFAFFMSPPRFWELLLGAFLAFGIVPRVVSRIGNELLAAIGLALIVMAVFTYSDTMSFPGLAALVPCAGAALIIFSGHERGVVSRILSSQPLVFLGLISYSLYLWHWPIIVYVRYYFGQHLTISQSLLIVAASLLIAAVSWRFIEQPFRRRQRPISGRAVFKAAAIAIVAAIGFGLFVVVSDGVPDRLPPEAMAVYSAKKDVAEPGREECFGGNVKDIEVAGGCPRILGEWTDQPLQYVVWGDSHAGAMAPAIAEAAAKARKPGLLVGIGSCPPLLDFNTGSSQREKRERCNRVNRAMLSLISAQNIPLVFMVARWPKYAHLSEYGDEGVFFDPSKPVGLDDHSAALRLAMDATLAELAKKGTKVILVMDVPEIGYDVPHALAKAVLTQSSGDIAPKPQAVRERQKLALDVLSSMAAKNGAILIDPTPEFCNESRCIVRKDGVLLYVDEDHISQSGAKMISHIFSSVF